MPTLRPSTRCLRRSRRSTRSGSWATWSATAPSPTRSSPVSARSGRSACAATTTPRRSASSTSTPSTSTRGRRWSGRERRSGRDPRVARGPPRAARARGHAARPRQPARPDLGVRDDDAGRARAAMAVMPTTLGLHGHTHVPIAFVEDDGHLQTMSPGVGLAAGLRRAARPAQPRQRRPAAGRHPDGVVAAARHRRRRRDLAPHRLRRRRRPGGHGGARPARTARRAAVVWAVGPPTAAAFADHPRAHADRTCPIVDARTVVTDRSPAQASRRTRSSQPSP